MSSFALALSFWQLSSEILIESAPISRFSSMGEPLAAIFPASIIESRLHSLSASSRYWVVKKMVMSSSLLSFSR